MGNSRWAMLLCGLLCVAAGVIPALDALDFFPGSASRMNAPRWVVLVAASLFVMAGMYVLLISLVGAGAAHAFGSVLGIALFVGLAAIVHWIAFGGGDRNGCSGGISAAGIGVSGAAPEWECRAAFGYGALLLDFIFLRGCAWWIGKRYPGRFAVRVFERISEWGMGLLLLPLVLLALLAGRVKDGLARITSARAARKAPPSERSP